MINLRKILSLVTCLCLFSLIGAAQDEAKSFSKQMNELKRSGDYVYAEATASTEADAKAACADLLKIEITKELSGSDDKSQQIIKDISEYNIEYLTQPRGELVRVFGYVKKSDIGAETSSKKSKAVEDDIYANTSKKKETAVTEEPVAQEPAVSQPTAQETAATQTVASEPAVTQPKAAEAATQTDIQLNTADQGLAKWQIDMIQTVAEQPTKMKAKSVLNRYKNQNKVKRLGDNTAANPRPADTFYIYYGADGAPVALLAPGSGDARYDFFTGTTANASQYSGLEYIWFQISK